MNDNEMDLWGDMLERTNRKTIVIENAQQKIIDSDNYCGRPVLGKIVVLPQSALEEFTCPYPCSCISITGTGS